MDNTDLKNIKFSELEKIYDNRKNDRKTEAIKEAKEIEALVFRISELIKRFEDKYENYHLHIRPEFLGDSISAVRKFLREIYE